MKIINQQISALIADYYRKKRKYLEALLKESDIVPSTLGSCCQNGIWTSRNPFPCCILDEASLCSSIEVFVLCLEVLYFGISKIILIGDPKQLPLTASSKFAAKCGSDRSMMEQFHEYFAKDDIHVD
ncbi:hypothetical protein JTE90_027452 [Oedothorax gibbosus]|uniref:DNA2/NAM7 helicase helicase domain-containing protein n=1 Tax=Oedothorax gibbosus TaxID=931172 RepID=A0AAV6VZG4_9ARAC|nr:hypothetical protein JTE90_027452 [Oedothorax gibbosus]